MSVAGGSTLPVDHRVGKSKVHPCTQATLLHVIARLIPVPTPTKLLLFLHTSTVCTRHTDVPIPTFFPCMPPFFRDFLPSIPLPHLPGFVPLLFRVHRHRAYQPSSHKHGKAPWQLGSLTLQQLGRRRCH